jgi:hypothetical protein
VTPVYKLSASSVTGRTVYGSMLAGNPAFEPPGDFHSIATVSVGSGGVANVEFTSIPATYTHLQVRGIARTTKSADGRGALYMQVNSDTSSNYSTHNLIGDGASVSSGNIVNSFYMLGTSYMLPSATATANAFGAFVLDILDYRNANKYKTFRNLIGSDFNSTTPLPGRVGLESGVWRQNTSAITSIKFYTDANNLAQYSSFALYGIKGA